MSTSTLTAVLAAAALAAGIGTAPAVSAADQDTVTTTVSYSDLNLTTQDGAKAMLQRIVNAAKRVCDPDRYIGDLPGMGEWRKYCVSASVKDTVSRLDAPTLTAIYRGKSQVFVAQSH